MQPLGDDEVQSLNANELKHMLKERAVKLYEAKEAEFPEEEMIRELERVVLLKTIDRKWMDHIDDMEILREGIGLQAYGQRDPLVEYKMAGFEMFDEMTANIQEETIRLLFHKMKSKYSLRPVECDDGFFVPCLSCGLDLIYKVCEDFTGEISASPVEGEFAAFFCGLEGTFVYVFQFGEG